ncbi:MAG TPA: DUF6010 family protein [Gemmatimonadales bacterium]|nr:DUF6010 family protein [Gemmatimonadales bacterium]
MALTVIISWYVVIGVLAAIGTVTITRSRFSPRVEQVFFALLLIPVAGMYVVFVGYFGDSSALRPEAYAVAVFTVLGLLGLRLPALLILGYALHGAWDLVHEAAVHLGSASGGAGQLTDIPLAYGGFCAAYDWCVAGYFFTRRSAWRQ